MLEKLKIAKYRFTLHAIERLELPTYKGSTLRGGFGSAFKRMACSLKGQVCSTCLLKETCAYSYIFETPVPADAEVLRTYRDVPRPFVIEPPLDTKTTYEPGEALDFCLILVGKAINYLPYFIITFKELGNIGIGRGRRKFTLQEISALNPLGHSEAVIYSSVDEAVYNEDLSVGFLEIQEAAGKMPSERITVRFLTPTRLKHRGEYTVRPEFHVLIRNILRRVSSLYYFHCGERWDYDYQGTIERAKGVELARAETEWVDWERYSRRQEYRMKLGGLMGEVSYEGELAPFMPLLLLGELVHVGKACVFGHGRYEICWGEDGRKGVPNLRKVSWTKLGRAGERC